MEKNKKHVIAGAGIAGLFAALRLLEKEAGEKIVIIDRDSEAGGLLKSWSHPKYGKFDIGTHILAETGNPEADTLLEPFYSGKNWNRMTGKTKDLPGCFYKGSFHSGNQYIPLDLFEKPDQQKHLNDIYIKLKENKTGMATSAYENYSARYGNDFIREIIEPIFQKTFGKSTKEMTPQSGYFLPLDRVISTEALSKEEFQSKEWRNVFGFPDQRTIPDEFVSKTASVYPKQRGIHLLVEEIVSYLKKKNVCFETEAEIEDIETAGTEIKKIHCSRKGGKFSFEVDSLIWSAGNIPLAKLLGITVDFKTMDKPKNTVIAHVVFKKNPGIGHAHYYYVLDNTLTAYRITNYREFCEDDKNKTFFPLTIEFLADDSSDIYSTVTGEILDMKLAVSGNDFEILNIVKLPSGFPVLSLRNDTAMENIRNAIRFKKLSNLVLIGIGSEKNLFFYRDILKDVLTKL